MYNFYCLYNFSERGKLIQDLVHLAGRHCSAGLSGSYWPFKGLNEQCSLLKKSNKKANKRHFRSIFGGNILFQRYTREKIYASEYFLETKVCHERRLNCRLLDVNMFLVSRRKHRIYSCRHRHSTGDNTSPHIGLPIEFADQLCFFCTLVDFQTKMLTGEHWNNYHTTS